MGVWLLLVYPAVRDSVVRLAYPDAALAAPDDCASRLAAAEAEILRLRAALDTCGVR